MKEWIGENREHVRVYDRKRYASNPEKKRKAAKLYYHNHKEEVKAKIAKYRREVVTPRKRLQLEISAGRPKPLTCEVCGAGGKIFYDHDHVTGKFRGWLCMQCNLALGHARDNTALLYKLIKYLDTSNPAIEI